jgi:hypothetical protein
MDPATIGEALRQSRADARKNYADRSRIVRARNGELSAWGHSYAFGIGASDVGRRYTSLLADMLRLRERSEAISGTTVAAEGSGASWGAVLQKIVRPSRGAVSGSGVTASAARGFAPPGGVFLCHYGVNDVQSLGNTSVLLEPVKQSLRAIVSRMRAGAIFEAETSTTFTFTGTWPTPADTTKNSGSGYRYATTAVPAYSITTPADFPGGTIAIGVHAPTGGGNGGTHSVSVDGGAPIVFVANSTRTGSATPFVLRIPNVPAGVHTIAVALSNVTNYTAVDYWQWEVPDADAPLILMLTQPLAVDYSAYGASPLVTDAGVAVLNQIIRDVAAEFGERVTVVDLSALDKDASMFAADKLHPSDKGHRRIAELCAAAVRSARWVIESGHAPAPRVEYGTAVPTGTRTFFYVGDEVRNSAPIEEGTAGAKYVTYGWLCTVEGRPGTWLPMRYLTGN